MAQHHGISWNDFEHERPKSRSDANSNSSSPSLEEGPTDLSKRSSRGRTEDHSNSKENGTVLAKTWHIPQEYHPDPNSGREVNNKSRSGT